MNFVLEWYELVLLMILGFGGFFILLVVLYNLVWKYIFYDEYNLDIMFDVGGNVSLSLMVVMVVF